MAAKVLLILFFVLAISGCANSPSSPKAVPADMIFVKGGTFLMGTEEEGSDEEPVHEVTLSGFYMGKFEVTQEEWQAVMGHNPSFFKGDRNPVEEIDWYAAVEYCNKKSAKENLTPCYTGSGDNIDCNFTADGYRLPTEAEWEFACRGGLKSQNYTYGGSNDVSEVAWYEGNSAGKPHPVGQKKPNELGLYDMSGNIWEWCWDWYGSEYYKNSPADNPTGPARGEERSYRGGGINGRKEYMRCSGRYKLGASYKHSDMGLRLVKKASGRVPEGMVFVKGGKFKMGSSDGGYGYGPAHRVTVNSFYIGKFEVSQEEWVAVMGMNHGWFSSAQCAVDGVRWYEAVEYCNRRSKMEGLTPCYTGSGDNITCNFKTNGYRLPTEAEWEYACRGGNSSKDYKFSGSNDWQEVAWCRNNVRNGRTKGGGLKKPNELGIHNMTGSAWEWCWDWYDKYYYKDSPEDNPKGPAPGIRRVLRGGSILNPPFPNYVRFARKSVNGFQGYGFRVVRSF